MSRIITPATIVEAALDLTGFSTDSDIVEAFLFANEAHKGIYRANSKVPYIRHPLTVASIVAAHDGDRAMVKAAILHDVVEDTEHTEKDIETHFGEEVAYLVDGVTDVAKRGEGTRKERVKKNRDHVATKCARIKTIKLGDVNHNLSNIMSSNPSFAPVYVEEKRLLVVEALQDGHPILLRRVTVLIDRLLRAID